MKYEKLSVDCPECGSQASVTLKDIAKERKVKCANGHSMQLADERGGARDALKALDDLEKAFKKLEG